MIRVTIELIPFGIGTPRVIGTAEIHNDGTGTPTTGNYRGWLFGKNRRRLKHEIVIEGFKRKRDNVWELLRQCLESRLDP